MISVLLTMNSADMTFVDIRQTISKNISSVFKYTDLRFIAKLIYSTSFIFIIESIY